MYAIVPCKKSTRAVPADYELKDFETFYKLAENITVPLVGIFRINIFSDKVEDIKQFVAVADRYSYMDIKLYVAETVADYITMYNTNLTIANTRSPFDEFKDMISEEGLLIEKYTLSTLYASIDHQTESMLQVVKTLKEEFGTNVLITEKMLTKVVILNKVIYPRTVLIDYLRLDRYRRNKLDKCISAIGKDIVLGAFIKNIKKLFEEKVEYFKTGKGSYIIKDIDTYSLNLMYRIFVLERGKCKDIYLLLELYERGLGLYDLVQTESD